MHHVFPLHENIGFTLSKKFAEIVQFYGTELVNGATNRFSSSLYRYSKLSLKEKKIFQSPENLTAIEKTKYLSTSKKIYFGIFFTLEDVAQKVI